MGGVRIMGDVRICYDLDLTQGGQLTWEILRWGYWGYNLEMWVCGDRGWERLTRMCFFFSLL